MRLLARIDMEDRFRSPLQLLSVGFGAILLGLLFVYLGSEMLEGDTAAFDMRILRAAQAFRGAQPWLAGVARDFSGLGSIAVMALFTATAVGYLLLVSARATALMLGASVILGSGANSLFKMAFGRSRPDAALAEMSVPSLSFPSGHASMAAIVFLTLGALLASTRTSPFERVYLLSTAATFAVLIGLSRVLLGVHWATDVLGGWAFGAAWAMAWLLLARFAARRDSRPITPRQSK